MRKWWDVLVTKGPGYGYYPNPVKTVLLTKEEHLIDAKKEFEGTGVTITTEGRVVLACPVGNTSFVSQFISSKMSEWCKQSINLSEIAQSQPHAAYSAFRLGLFGSWTYLCRVYHFDKCELQPLEDIINNKFTPALTGLHPPSVMDRHLLSLPQNFDSLGLFIPLEFAARQFNSSSQICSPLIDNIINQSEFLLYDSLVQQTKKKQECWTSHTRDQEEQAEVLFQSLPPDTRRLVDLACEKGSYAWLSTPPLQEHGFCLNKQVFHNALCVR